MERQKGVKKISIFSGEGVSLLSQDIQMWSSEGETERCIFEPENERTERQSRSVPTSSTVQCTSCHTTFTDRGEQVYK